MNRFVIISLLFIGSLVTTSAVNAATVSDQGELAGDWRFHFRWEEMSKHPRNPPQLWFTFQSAITQDGSAVAGSFVNPEDSGSFTCTFQDNVCADGSMNIELYRGTWEGFTFELEPDGESGRGSVTLRAHDGEIIENSFTMQRKAATHIDHEQPAPDTDGIISQVLEGLELAAHVKAAVTEFTTQNFSFPNDYLLGIMADPASLEGTYVESVVSRDTVVYSGGEVTETEIVITYGNDADPAIHGRNLKWTAIKTRPGTPGPPEWICASEDIEDQYLPLECQRQPREAIAGGSVIPSGSDATYRLDVRVKSMFVHADCEGRVGNPGEWVYEVNLTAPGQSTVRTGTKKYPSIDHFVTWADQTNYQLRGKLKLRGIAEKDLAAVAIQLRATEWDPENPDPSMNDLEATEFVKYAPKRQDGTVELDGGRCAIRLGYNATWKKE